MSPRTWGCASWYIPSLCSKPRVQVELVDPGVDAQVETKQARTARQRPVRRCPRRPSEQKPSSHKRRRPSCPSPVHIATITPLPHLAHRHNAGPSRRHTVSHSVGVQRGLSKESWGVPERDLGDLAFAGRMERRPGIWSCCVCASPVRLGPVRLRLNPPGCAWALLVPRHLHVGSPTLARLARMPRGV